MYRLFLSDYKKTSALYQVIPDIYLVILMCFLRSISCLMWYGLLQGIYHSSFCSRNILYPHMLFLVDLLIFFNFHFKLNIIIIIYTHATILIMIVLLQFLQPTPNQYHNCTSFTNYCGYISLMVYSCRNLHQTLDFPQEEWRKVYLEIRNTLYSFRF